MDNAIELSDKTKSNGQHETSRLSVKEEALSNRLNTTDKQTEIATSLSTDTRMIQLFAGAILCSTIYVIFPVLNSNGSTNYWAYYLAKEQWWSLFGNAGFVEMAEAGLPGSPLNVYVYSYIFGWFIPPMLHVCAYLTNTVGNPILGTLAVTTSIIVTTSLYVGWQIKVAREQPKDLAAFRLSATDDGVTHDIFSAVMDADNVGDVMEDGRYSVDSRESSLVATVHAPVSTVPGIGGSDQTPENVGKKTKAVMSAYRAAWLKTRTQFKEDARRLEASHDSLKRRRQSRMSLSRTVSINNPLSGPDAAAAARAAKQGSGDEEAADEEDKQYEEIMQTAGAVGGLEDWTVEEEEGEQIWDVVPRFIERHRLLPRFWYHQLGEVPGAHVTTKNRPLHVLSTVTFYFGWVVVYFILMQFTFGFRESDKKYRIYWFMFFTVASTGCKLAMKRIGLQIDRGKVGTCSMFFVGEFMCTLFYFTFYRMLFEEFVDWYTFIFVQVLHLLQEWVLYCLRGTTTFYRFFKSLPAWTGPLKNVFVMKGLSHRDWQIFLTLDFALRAEIMLFSAPGFILPLIVTGECYWVRSFLKPISVHQFEMIFLQIFLACLLEIVNGYVMYKVFFESHKLRVLKYSINCFSDARFCVICFCISVCLFINPFAAFESYFLNFEF